jgi:hypothetical protein
MVGMTDIECRLHDHCEAIFGDSFKDLPTQVIGPCSEFAEEFEVIKRSFDGKNLSKTYRLRLLPLKESANINPVNYDSLEGKIILKGYGMFQDTTVCFDLHGYRTELRDMFDHLIQKALEQVDDQIGSAHEEGPNANLNDCLGWWWWHVQVCDQQIPGALPVKTRWQGHCAPR